MSMYCVPSTALVAGDVNIDEVHSLHSKSLLPAEEESVE